MPKHIKKQNHNFFSYYIIRHIKNVVNKKCTKKKGIKTMRKTIITVAGRTAAGKSSIAKKLSDKLGLKLLQSYTTRAPRPDESADLEHSDHIFISDDEFDKLQDIAAETTINGVRYCTTMSMLNQSDFYVIDPDGIDYLKKNHSRDFRIVQFYVYAEEDIRKKRFEERGKTKNEFVNRNNAENKQFDEYEQNHEYDIIIFNNGNIDDAVEVMESYVTIVLEDRLKEIEAKKNGTWIEKTESEDDANKSNLHDEPLETPKLKTETDEMADSTADVNEPEETKTSKNVAADDQFSLDDDDEDTIEKSTDNAKTENISNIYIPDEAEKGIKAAEPDPFSLDDDDDFNFGKEQEEQKGCELTSEKLKNIDEEESTESNEPSAIVTPSAGDNQESIDNDENQDNNNDDDDDDDDGEEAILID